VKPDQATADKHSAITGGIDSQKKSKEKIQLSMLKEQIEKRIKFIQQ
jgi:hypothetical protein